MQTYLKFKGFTLLPLLFWMAMGHANPEIDGRCNTDPIAGKTASRPFGHDALRSGQGFIQSGAIDESYLLSPGDQISISIWGQLNRTFDLEIDSEGYLILPDNGGRLPTNGLSIGELKPRVIQALAGIYGGYINPQENNARKDFVDIRIGKLRNVSIMVIGEVEKPGVYSLSAGAANVVNALHQACGVKEHGSLRHILIRRNSQTIPVDLYSFLLEGEGEQRHLLPGDAIVVPLMKRAANILGEVRRPGTYELTDQENLNELISLAGGFNPEAAPQLGQIIRSRPGEGRSLLDVDIKETSNPIKEKFILFDGDQVNIPKNIQSRSSIVEIQGDGILRKGTYAWIPGMTMDELIQKAGGLTSDAYLPRIDLMRTGDDLSKELLTYNLVSLYAKDSSGNLVFKGESNQKVPIQPMDLITVQSGFDVSGKDREVELKGHVKEPGHYVLAKNMSLNDLLFAHGGFMNPRYLQETYLEEGYIRRKSDAKANEKLIRFSLKELLRPDTNVKIALQDGDEINVLSSKDFITSQSYVIQGLVKKPGIIPYAEGTRLKDILLMAGGFSRPFPEFEIFVTHKQYQNGPFSPGNSDGEKPNIIKVRQDSSGNLQLEHDPALLPGDALTARKSPTLDGKGYVTILGAVLLPGQIQIPKNGLRFSEAASQAGGLSENALPEGTLIQRQNEPEEIALNGQAALESPGSLDNLKLQDGDVVTIPENPGTVKIRGAVGRELVLPHIPGRELSDYIGLCGGYLDKADPEKVRVLQLNGLSVRSRIPVKGKSSIEIPAGSTIEVPFLRATERMLTVQVKGAVHTPAIIQYIEGARLGYYLGLAGGFTDDAELDGISVMLPDGGLLTKTKDQPFNPPIPADSQILVIHRKKEVSQ